MYTILGPLIFGNSQLYSIPCTIYHIPYTPHHIVHIHIYIYIHSFRAPDFGKLPCVIYIYSIHSVIYIYTYMSYRTCTVIYKIWKKYYVIHRILFLVWALLGQTPCLLLVSEPLWPPQIADLWRPEPRRRPRRSKSQSLKSYKPLYGSFKRSI